MDHAPPIVSRLSPLIDVSCILLLCACALVALAPQVRADDLEEAAKVDFHWGVKIPLRDGVHLNATVYLPKNQRDPAPCIFTLTPYIAQSYHPRGVYFAAHGLPFLTVDVRGRGNSEGEFHPLIQEAKDGYDVVEWLAKQPYCNGKVSMWGGSYAGYDQWAAAKEFPPHLATIVPVASPYAGIDFPMSTNLFAPYDMQWLTFTSGHASQEVIFGDAAFWASRFRHWFESGAPFAKLDSDIGNPSTIFQEWISHPHPDAYWDAYNPTAADYAKISIPILTITGSHDGDQPGALQHYKNSMANATPAARAQHYLIIGPWDHAGTRTPNAQFGGLNLGAKTLLDLPRLHVQWYEWTMRGGPKPEFLKKPVAYYVMYADRWRYADSLAAVTGETRTLYLDSVSNATDVYRSGLLDSAAGSGKPDHYRYDPKDVSSAALESSVDPNSLVDQRLLLAQQGKELIYHSAPFDKDTEISGFFKLTAWIGLDQPDTDFTVTVYEIRQDGSSIPLAGDQLRARYRESLREPKLVHTKAALRYDFEHFTFVSQEVKAGSRLRVVLAPVNSIFAEKNYNSDGEVAKESMQDARPVTVTLYHDKAHPSALYVPLGRAMAEGELEPPESMFTAPKRAD